MADKGNVYYCTWEKDEDDGFVGWEIKYPARKARAASFRELFLALGDLVGEYHNDHEAALQLDPPEPLLDRFERLFVDDFIIVGFNEGFRYSESATQLFTGGRCGGCGQWQGVRTEQPIVVTSFGGQTDGAFSGQGNDRLRGWLYIFSDKFLSLLSPTERSLFDVRQVKWERARRPHVFEILPKELIKPVAIRGLDYTGVRCAQCGHSGGSHGNDLGWCVQVISRSELPKNAPEGFFVGDPTNVHLCLKRERYLQLRGNPKARKLSVDRLAIVDEAECDRSPRLPTYEELAAFRQKHGFKVPFSFSS